MSDDPVIDYLVVEAIALKAGEEEQKAHEERRRQEWKSKHDELRKRATL